MRLDTSRLLRRLAPLVGVWLALAEPRPEAAPAQQVFRTGATLVTVDAVVTDKDGRQVTDLTIDDFELVADGTQRPLRHVVYVPLGSTPAECDSATGQDAAISPRPTPPATYSTDGEIADQHDPPSAARVMAVVVERDSGVRERSDTRRYAG